jgi:hypothetical protein
MKSLSLLSNTDVRLSIGSIRTCRHDCRLEFLLSGSTINRVVKWFGDSIIVYYIDGLSRFDVLVRRIIMFLN